jgi:thiol-disulfide isomerase/thioredoxin
MSDRRRQLVIGVVVAVLLVVLIAGTVVATRNSAPAPVRGVAGADGETVSLAGADPITGDRVDLAEYRGKPVVINIWASWCPGCIAEAEDLRRFAAAHPEAQVIGLDIQDSREGARDFYRQWGWTWPSVFDPSGELAARLGLQGLPTTIFLDEEHRVVAQIVGEGNFEGFEAGLEQALAG